MSSDSLSASGWIALEMKGGVVSWSEYLTRFAPFGSNASGAGRFLAWFGGASLSLCAFGVLLQVAVSLVSESLMKATWQRVAASSAAQTARLQHRRTAARFRVIKPAKSMRTWEAVEEMLASLKGIEISQLEQHAQYVSEPAVFRNILGALSPDQEDPVELSDDEFWEILCILKTVSDCLHDAQKTR